MKIIIYGALIYSCIALTASNALPAKSDAEVPAAAEPAAAAAPTAELSTFASDASQLIATSLLKSYADIDGNQVHSPLGVTSILAVLAEASAGETYDEFNKVFGYPKQRENLRSSFKRILGKYQNREYTTEPSFQTWLYIYRNYTARDDFKRVVRENYFVEVKDINRNVYDWSEPNTSLDLQSTTAATNSKDVVGFETLKRIKLDTDESTAAAAAAAVEATPEKKDTYGEEILNKEASKFDRIVDDKQYVEKPVILEEIKQEKLEQEKQQVDENSQKEVAAEKLEIKAEDKVEKQEVIAKPAADEQKPIEQTATYDEVKKPEELQKAEKENLNLNAKDKSKREDDLNVEENETVQADEKVHKNLSENGETATVDDLSDSNEPQKVSIPLQKLESAIEMALKQNDGEIMLALESHIRRVRRVYNSRSLFNKDDITSSLSANSVTGREVGSKTKMLLFNGLYYRGNWATPFFENPRSEEFFYMTAEDDVKVPMMYAKGTYYLANLDHLNAKVICLPYQNKKYAMMIFVPNEIEGLRSIIDKLQPSDFKLAKAQAKETNLFVSLPKFQIEETTRSESSLKNLGLKKLFSRDESDLSNLSDDRDLHIDEIVQFVSIRVDEGSTTQVGLTATNAEERTTSETEKYERFAINRPFAYFVMDCEEDFILVSGKIYSPEFKEDEPVSIEIEYEKT